MAKMKASCIQFQTEPLESGILVRAIAYLACYLTHLSEYGMWIRRLTCASLLFVLGNRKKDQTRRDSKWHEFSSLKGLLKVLFLSYIKFIFGFDIKLSSGSLVVWHADSLNGFKSFSLQNNYIFPVSFVQPTFPTIHIGSQSKIFHSTVSLDRLNTSQSTIL